jgi:hypothetical protein
MGTDENHSSAFQICDVVSTFVVGWEKTLFISSASYGGLWKEIMSRLQDNKNRLSKKEKAIVGKCTSL